MYQSAKTVATMSINSQRNIDHMQMLTIILCHSSPLWYFDGFIVGLSQYPALRLGILTLVNIPSTIASQKGRKSATISGFSRKMASSRSKTALDERSRVRDRRRLWMKGREFARNYGFAEIYKQTNKALLPLPSS